MTLSVGSAPASAVAAVVLCLCAGAAGEEAHEGANTTAARHRSPAHRLLLFGMILLWLLVYNADDRETDG
jgi:hypothetical protein